MIIEYIQWKHLSLINIIACLPTNTALLSENSYQFTNHYFLLGQIGSNVLPTFIRLANIVGRRSDDKRDDAIRKHFQKRLRLSMMKRHNVTRTIIIHDGRRVKA